MLLLVRGSAALLNSTFVFTLSIFASCAFNCSFITASAASNLCSNHMQTLLRSVRSLRFIRIKVFHYPQY
jgi:hypothetical protein